MKKYTAFVLLFAVALGAFAQTKPAPKKEQDYYEIKTLPIPKEIYLEVGGLATMPDGRLAVSTRRGDLDCRESLPKIESPNLLPSFRERIARGVRPGLQGWRILLLATR